MASRCKAARFVAVWLFAALCGAVPGAAQVEYDCSSSYAPYPVEYGQIPVYQVGPQNFYPVEQQYVVPAPTNAQIVYPPVQQVMPQPAMPYMPAPQPAANPMLPFDGYFMGGQIPPAFVHRHSVFGEFLFIRPRNAEVAYALPIDGPVAPVLGNEVPVGPTAVVDPDYDIGYAAGFNFALDQCNSLRAKFTMLETDASDAASVTAPRLLRSLVSHPLGANAATDTLDASASLDIDLMTIDADYRSLLFGNDCGCAYAVNWFAGAQYAELDQQFRSAFTTINTTNVNTNVNFDGIGLRLGLEGERHWPQRGVFVYGTGTTNVLFGEFDANYRQIHSLNGQEAFTSWSAGRVVPVLDLELGVGWITVRRHLRLSAGYRVSTWFNVIQTDTWVQAVQNNNFTDMSDTLTFDGLVARAEWQF